MRFIQPAAIMSLLILSACSKGVEGLSQGLASDLPKTSAVFLDECKEPTLIATYTGGDTDSKKRKVRLHVEVSGLQPGTKIHLVESVAPMATRDPSIVDAEKDDTTKKADDYGMVVWDNKISLKLQERVMWSDPRLHRWRALVSWKQVPNSDEPDLGLASGGGAAIVYVVDGTDQHFYRQEGPAVCSWRSPLTISSQYYYNPNATELTIEHTYRGTYMQGSDWGTSIEGSVESSPYRHHDGPMVGSGRRGFDVLAWFFPEWNRLKTGTQTDEVSREWKVKKYGGGYFGTMIRFNRYNVVEYSPVDNGSCIDWVPSRNGQLDVGFAAENFYDVPYSMSDNPDASLKQMETLQASSDVSNPCASDPDRDGNPAFKVDMNQSSSMYFYPEQER